MSTKIIKQITPYVRLTLGVAGEEYDFKKNGETIKGVTRSDTCKITTPYGSLNFKAVELLGIIALSNDAKVVNELEARAGNEQ